MKKLISLLLCGLMLCSLIIPASAAESTTWTQDELDAIVLSNPYWTVSKYEAFGSEVKFDGTSDAFWVNKSNVMVNGKIVGDNSISAIIKDHSEGVSNNNDNIGHSASQNTRQIGQRGKWKADWTETDGIRFYEYCVVGETDITTDDTEWLDSHPGECENFFNTNIPMNFNFKTTASQETCRLHGDKGSVYKQQFDILIYADEKKTVTDTNRQVELTIKYTVNMYVQCIDRTYTTVQNPPVVTNYNYAKFSDISAQAWYAPTIAVAYETGMLQGTDKDERGRLVMNPQGQLTLAQAITMVARIYEKMSGITIMVYAPKPWYRPYMDYAKNYNLLPFDELCNMHNMNKPITRAQFASIVAMLPRLKDQSGKAEYRISDVTSANKYSSSIQQLYYRGITQGSGTQKRDIGLYSIFYPNKTLTRAEAAAMLCRTLYSSMQKDNTQFKKS